LLSLPNFKLLAPELTFGLFVLIGSMVITLQYSLDVIIVKHYFDPHTAGLYAGVASVARIIFFLTASVALVLMSWVKLGAGAGQNRKVLLGSLGLTAAAGLPVVIACVWQPHKITTLLMGNAYQSVADILPKLAVAVFVIAIINVFVSYFLALRRYGMAPALLAGAVITYWLMVTHHATLNAIVQNLLIGSFAMLGLLVVWLASGRFKELA
jgi:O-antigen/teichoic acid export membrane protein